MTMKTPETVSINRNARRLIGANSLPKPREEFSNYKEKVEMDKSGNLMQMFQSGAYPKKLILRGLGNILRDISVPEPDARAKAVLELIESLATGGKNQIEVETACKRMLSGMVPDCGANVKEALSGRSELIFRQISGLVHGERVLDLGAGDGKVGELVSGLGKGVSLVDVIDFNASGLPLTLYDGKKLPFADKEFDASLLLTVLHHADAPLEVLKEAMRVSRSIILIESVYFNTEHMRLNMFLDWFYNRVIHNGVNCPFNFQSPQGWESTFAKLGLKITDSIDLGVDQKVVPEYHWLYRLEAQ
jgi:SAM-dependent methyltransferase